MCNSNRFVLIEPQNVGRADAFYTTPLFWDCECEQGYIHSCTEETCAICKATREESPDSRIDEIFRHAQELNDKLVGALEFVCWEVQPDLVQIPF